MDIHQIIKRPVITEKSAGLRETQNKVTFEVDPKANKSEIKKAIESIWKVKVTKINTVTLPGKARRFGMTVSEAARWKKAVATLKAGDKIDLFEGA